MNVITGVTTNAGIITKVRIASLPIGGGEEGEDGVPGPPGATGAAGAAGSAGADGATGQQGPPGLQGEDGEDGVQGIPGRDGATGATGAAGADGTNGQQGPPGLPGEDGEEYAPIPGASGAAGATGATGSTGATGQQGPPGISSDGDGEDFVYVPPSNAKPKGVLIQKQRTDTGAVATGTTTIPFDDTIPALGEGFQVLSQSITPTDATSLIHIVAQIYATPSVAAFIIASLIQDAAASATLATAVYNGTATAGAPLYLDYWYTAASVASTTWSVRIGMDRAGTTTFNGSSGARYLGGVLNSFLEITEWKQ